MSNHNGKQKQNTMFGGVAILAAGIAIVKLIGALFKIPLFNVLGETGSADFYNAYSIYAVLLTVSTAGLPVALSKTVAEANTLGRHNQKQRVFRVALSAFLTMGLASFIVMWFGADWLAGLMNNSHAAPGIRALAPAVVCVGCLSAFRGYAQGHMNMTPTSVSQIIEALCKLILGLALASFIMSRTFTGAMAQEQTSLAAAGAITGVTVGTVLALVYMAVNYLRTRTRAERGGTDRPDGAGHIFKNLMRIAVPITLSTSLVPIINVLDNALVQGQLQDALGMTEQASRALYGNYTVAVSLHNLPGSFMTALTAAIIPAVSAALARGNRDGSARITGSVLRITGLLAMPMGVGLLVLARPIMKLLYPRYNVTLTGPMLAILGPAAVCVCLVLVCNAVFQAYGHVFLPIATTLVGGAVKIIANYNLVSVPDIHIYGAPVGTLLCYVVVLLLDLILLRRIVPGIGRYAKVFGKPLLASTVMGAAAWAGYGLLERLLIGVPAFQSVGAQGTGAAVLSGAGNALAVFLAIGGAAVLYLVLVVAMRAVSRDDVLLMPKGEKIAKILRF
ncbi:MAG: oligosaccharide flippase family protein [Oscillospiraceae bacterium]|nr:oligosaccharide flippase family protein [Oscillospiraceae bacterium]